MIMSRPLSVDLRNLVRTGVGSGGKILSFDLCRVHHNPVTLSSPTTGRKETFGS